MSGNMYPSLSLSMYEAVVSRLIKPGRLLEVPGDLVDFGAFLGGGTRFLAEHVERSGSGKSVWAVDAFDPAMDPTVNSRGRSMESIYREAIPSGRSCREVFLETTADLANVELFAGDTRTLRLPDAPLCFAFVDCGHAAENIRQDFSTVWRRLSPGGVVAFHDYGGDLPGVTRAIHDCLGAVANELGDFGVFPDQWIIWIAKGADGRSAGAEAVEAFLEGPGRRLRVAVASYREDVSWTDETMAPVVIYDASGAGRVAGGVAVENRAREAGQYLHHIVENYPDFREWEVFVQGNPFEHTTEPILLGGGFAGNWAPFQPLGRVASFNPERCDHDRWAARFAREWFGGIPGGLRWVVGAQFAVHRNLLLNRSLDYWVTLRDKVVREEETSPWALERLWSAIF